MDDVLKRRLVGVCTLALGAFLLSWLLPRPGLERLQGTRERVVTIDLTRPDAPVQERRAGEPAPPAAAVEPVDAGAAPGVASQMRSVAPTDEGPRLGTDPPLPPPELSPAPEFAPDAGSDAVRPSAPPAASKPAAPSAPRPDTKPVPTPEPKAERKPDPKPAVTSANPSATAADTPARKPAPDKPAAKPAAKPVPSTAPNTPAVKPATGGKVLVQAGAYSHLDKAESVRARAAGGGVSCVISPADTAKGTLYRLRCGPYADRAAADRAIGALKAAGIAAQVVSGG